MCVGYGENRMKSRGCLICTGLWREQDEVIHGGTGGEAFGRNLCAQRGLRLCPHPDDRTMRHGGGEREVTESASLLTLVCCLATTINKIPHQLFFLLMTTENKVIVAAVSLVVFFPMSLWFCLQAKGHWHNMQGFFSSPVPLCGRVVFWRLVCVCVVEEWCFEGWFLCMCCRRVVFWRLVFSCMCVAEEWCFEGWFWCMCALWKSGVLKVGSCVTVAKDHDWKLVWTLYWSLTSGHFLLITGISSSEMCPWKDRAVCLFGGAACSCSVSMGVGAGGWPLKSLMVCEGLKSLMCVCEGLESDGVCVRDWRVWWCVCVWGTEEFDGVCEGLKSLVCEGLKSLMVCVWGTEEIDGVCVVWERDGQTVTHIVFYAAVLFLLV